jgi:hypothetical protein
MGMYSHLSTWVGTQSPKYLEMAQGHISVSYVHKYLSETKAKVLEINACVANQILEMILNHHKKLLSMVFALFFFSSNKFLSTNNHADSTPNYNYNSTWSTMCPVLALCTTHNLSLGLCFLNAYWTKVLDTVAHEVWSWAWISRPSSSARIYFFKIYFLVVIIYGI